MADWKLKLYHHLPPFMRNIGASWHGWQLRHWRYGPELEDLVQEALEREYWSAEKWKTYQENRLSYILHQAATRVPYYRDQWSERRRKSDHSSWEYLENWPILEKEALRKNPHAFIADNVNVNQLSHVPTSGTTGMPIKVYRNKQMLQTWYALFEARWRRWYGVTLDTRWAILGGRLITPFNQRQPPFWVWNKPMKQLYMSSYHLSSNTVKHYLDAIVRYEIEYIYCYSSSGYSLAHEVLKNNLNTPELKFIITNAEPLYGYQREAMKRAFSCPVYETYGQTESILAASECEYGNLHLWPEGGYTEITDDNNQRLPKGQIGHVISTSLINDQMLFVRYRIGDHMSLKENTATCSCGRTLPMIDQITGRTDDVLITSDGRRIGRLDPVFKSDLAIKEAQIIQQSFDELIVKIVPIEGFGVHTKNAITEQLKLRMGDIDIRFEVLTEIPRTSNGKFRAVISNLSDKDRTKV